MPEQNAIDRETEDARNEMEVDPDSQMANPDELGPQEMEGNVQKTRLVGRPTARSLENFRTTGNIDGHRPIIVGVAVRQEDKADLQRELKGHDLFGKIRVSVGKDLDSGVYEVESELPPAPPERKLV